MHGVPYFRRLVTGVAHDRAMNDPVDLLDLFARHRWDPTEIQALNAPWVRRRRIGTKYSLLR